MSLRTCVIAGSGFYDEAIFLIITKIASAKNRPRNDTRPAMTTKEIMGDIIDLKEVLERVQDDKELLLELLDIFQEDFIVKRQSLTEALKDNDVQRIKELAHSIKGASGNVSAKPIYANCLKMEQMARDNNISQMGPMLQELDRQFQELKVNIEKLKKEFGK